MDRCPVKAHFITQGQLLGSGYSAGFLNQKIFSVSVFSFFVTTYFFSYCKLDELTKVRENPAVTGGIAVAVGLLLFRGKNLDLTCIYTCVVCFVFLAFVIS